MAEGRRIGGRKWVEKMMEDLFSSTCSYALNQIQIGFVFLFWWIIFSGGKSKEMVPELASLDIEEEEERIAGRRRF